MTLFEYKIINSKIGTKRISEIEKTGLIGSLSDLVHNCIPIESSK